MAAVPPPSAPATSVQAPSTPAAPPVRFGILGCANIARKISKAIHLANNATVVAVGSRSVEKASSFAQETGFQATAKAYGSYDDVLDDPEVDAIYCPLPTTLHRKYGVLAAQKKKHLLIEKPAALSVGDLDEILGACESNGVQYMDATMWIHHPRTPQMRAFLNDPQRFGKLKAVHSIYCNNCGPDFLQNDIRVKPDLDSLGALGDSGWYCIRSILWATDYQLPKTVTAFNNVEYNDAGVILSCGASLIFEDGKIGTFHCSFLHNLTMDVNVLGDNGYLRFHDFVVPFNEHVGPYYVNSNTQYSTAWVRVEPSPTEHLVPTEIPQEAQMVKAFSSLVGRIKRGDAAVEKNWFTISRKTQLVVDAVKASIDSGFKAIEVVY